MSRKITPTYCKNKSDQYNFIQPLKKQTKKPVQLISCYLHIKRNAVLHAPNVLGISNITVLPKPLLRSSRTIASASYIATSKIHNAKTREKWGTLAVHSWSKAKVSTHMLFYQRPSKMHFNIAANSLPARNAVSPDETPGKTQIPPSQQRWSDVK